jgi:hypothetical protein
MGILAIAVVTVYGDGLIWIWLGWEWEGATFYTGKARKTEYKTHKLKKRKQNGYLIIINT